MIMAPPLWAHADLAVGCLDAGKHVLCEKMMAWDLEGCERMRARRCATIGCSRSDTSGITTRCTRPPTTGS